MANRDKKLNILFWRTNFYGGITEGGVAAMYYGKIMGLKKLGHKIAFVSSGPMILPDEVKYFYIPYNKFLRNFPEVLNLPYNEKSVREILKIIDFEKPDLFHLHHHDFHYAGAIVKEKTGLPFFLHMDGIQYWVKKNWGKLYLEKLLKWAEEIQIYSADIIITPSEALKKLIIENFKINPDKILPAPNGFDPDMFNPEINGEKIRKKYDLEKNFVVGFSGTFGQWHGVDILAESIKYMKKLIPNLKVFLIGDGLLRPLIEEILKENNVINDTVITGFLPFNKVPSYLAACDVLTTPCISNDDNTFFNSPIKLFEYMAMGKPIVATDVGQQGLIFKDKVNGIVIPEKDPEAIAEAVFELYKNPDLRKKISDNALADAINKYDWKHNSQKIVDAYFNIIENR